MEIKSDTTIQWDFCYSNFIYVWVHGLFMMELNVNSNFHEKLKVNKKISEYLQL